LREEEVGASAPVNGEHWKLAWGFVGAIAAFELVLCRASGGPVAFTDLAAEIAAAAAVAGVLTLLPVESPLRALAGVAIVLAAALGILVPGSLDLPAWDVPARLLAGVLVLVELPLSLVGRWRGPSPRRAIAWLAVAAVAAWLIIARKHATPPSDFLTLAFAGLVVAGLVLGRRAWWLAPLALLPSQGEPEQWRVEGPAPARPDVIMISIDTLRLDAAREMAFFQTLGEEGAFFDAQAPAPWTLPSMATAFTGLEPGRHGALRHPEGGYSRIRDAVPTLAERLGAAGYDTAATAVNPFTGPRFGLERGFARYRHEQTALFGLPRVFSTRQARPIVATWLSWAGVLGETLVGVDRRLADAAALIEARRDRPLFLWVLLIEPHLPYAHAWGVQSLDWEARLRFAALHRVSEEVPEDIALLRRAYRHEVQVVDRALSAWLAELPPAPHGRIVVAFSDHGEEFDEHGGWEHGHTMYQELLGVPLAVSGVPGLDTSGPAGLVDVVPTLLAALEIESENLDGRDLRTPSLAAYRSANPLYGALDQRAVRRGAEKLIERAGTRASYRLDADPLEQAPGRSEALTVLLPPPGATRGEAVELDPELEAQLEALGYAH
jgi:arylsulfatase A-like enzyme